MPEPEDSGSGCGQGCQEQNGIFQSKHDGGFSAGVGKFIQMLNHNRQLIGHAAQRQIG